MTPCGSLSSSDGLVIFFCHSLCTNDWELSVSCVKQGLELVKMYQVYFYCANAPSLMHYYIVLLRLTWSIAPLLKWMQIAFWYCVTRVFIRLSLHWFLLRSLFFQLCFFFPLLSLHWLQELGPHPACLFGFSLKIHLHLDHTSIEVLVDKCHIAEIVVSMSPRGQDSAY